MATIARSQAAGFTDYGAEAEDIARRRKMAEMMQMQALEPIKQETAGGYVVPISWTQGLAKALQAGVGGYQQGQATRDQRELVARQKAETAQKTADFFNALRGSAGTPGTPDQPFQATTADYADNPNLQADETGMAVNPGTPGTPAIAPDRGRAMAIAMGTDNPTLQAVAGQMMTQDMNTQRVQAMLQSMGMAPGGTMTPTQALGQGGQGPTNQAAQMVGQPTGQVPPGVSPQAWQAAIATGDIAAIAKLIQEGYKTANTPVVNRGFGIGRMVNGQYVPDQASLDQALAMERGRQGLELPYRNPVQMPMSDGRTANIFPSEFPTIQQGNIPPRLGGQPQQQAPGVTRLTAPDDASALALSQQLAGQNVPFNVSVGNAPVAPTLGVSQSQTEAQRDVEDKEVARTFGRELGQQAAKIFTDGAASAQALPILKNMEALASTFEPGKLTPLKSYLGQWAVATGAMTEDQANKSFGNLGSIQALTSASTRLAAISLRQSDGNPAVKQLELMLDSMPNGGQTPEGFALTMKYMQAAEQMKLRKMQEAAAFFRNNTGGNSIRDFESEWSKKLPALQNEIYGSITPPTPTAMPQGNQSQQVPSGLPPGATPVGRTPDGRRVFKTPDGKQYVQ